MSALIVKGKVVGVIIRSFPKKKNPDEKVTIASYYVVDKKAEGKPVELKSFNLERKGGEDIECPVYLRFWTKGERSGCEVTEVIKKKDSTAGSNRG